MTATVWTSPAPELRPGATGVMARLEAELSELQRRRDSELEVHGDGVTWLEYRLYLLRMFGFVAPVEHALGAIPELASVLPDAALRNHKTALLSHDLFALGVARRDFTQLPRMPLAELDGLATALGWTYVLERDTLGGRALYERLAPRLPLEMASAAAYLRCYGDEVAARWRQLGAALDAFAGSDEARAGDIVGAAIDALVRLHDWLRPSSSARRAGAGSARA